MRAYERLLNYVKFDTASDSNSPTCPSTPGQLEFGKYLVEEMKGIGVQDVAIDENGYVFGTIPSTIDGWDGTVIGFIAHMDVVRDVPATNIKPRVVKNYDGTTIVLDPDANVTLSPEEFPELLGYKGMDLIVTDGKTLLGADNKAGIAEIMTMAETLIKDPSIKHGKIRIAFTPDEEIGRGADKFDVAAFGAKFAYTADGGAFGQAEYETFNASAVKVKINGKNIHPGSAKDKMKNAILIGMAFNALLPECERPEHTEQYEGFYHLNSIGGSVETAEMAYILRDHDAGKNEQRKVLMQQAADKLNAQYGPNTIVLEMTDSYRNMAEQIKPHWHLIETAFEAIREVGGEPVSVPVRGGTDGSRLSFMGLPCPNLGTGGHNYHGKQEYACVQSMDKASEMLIKIAEKYAVK